jgi:sodium-dependent dicarboxylate transporter 2/3/5
MESPHPPETGARRRWPKILGLFVGAALGVVLLCVPMPALTPAMQRLVAVLALVIVYWVTEAIPLPATALIGAALCILLGVAPDRAVLAPFGHPVVFMYIGMFFLAAGMQKHGLDRRLALTVLAFPGVARSPWRVYAAMGGMTALLSMWMNNLSTTAVVMPIALGVLRTSRVIGANRESRQALVLLIPFAASMGGLATPVGTAPNLVSIAYMEQLAGVRISMLRWMVLTAPLVLVLMAYLLWQLRPRVTNSPVGEAESLEREFTAQLRALGRWQRGEIITAASLFIAILLWITPGLGELFGWSAGWVKELPEEMVGLCAGLVLFVTPVCLRRGEFALSWHEAKDIDWGTVMLAAGGLSLGGLIFSTGLAKVMGEAMGGWLGTTSLWGIVAAGILLSVGLSEVASNTAAANVTMPIMLAVAQAAGVDPLPVGLACCLACSFGFMLPVSTGPNAIAYATGEVRIPGMIRHGLALDFVGVILIWVTLRLMWPLVDLLPGGG